METPKVLPVVEPANQKAKPHHPHLPKVDVGVQGGGALLLMLAPVKTGKCLYQYSKVNVKRNNKLDIINICDVKNGDYVLDKSGYVKVLDVMKQGIKYCYKINVNENELILTEDHKIHTDKGMKRLIDINPSKDLITTISGKYKIDSFDIYGEVECYDLEVEHTDHTFYCNNILVSNSTIISNLFLNPNFYGQYFFDDVQILSNTIANDVTSRYMKKAFNVTDHYSDAVIDNLIKRQYDAEPEDRLDMALILDDCLGSIKRESKINHLASRYRHASIKLLIISSQKFKGSVSPVIRSNATNIIIGSPFPNQKELMAIAEEYGDNFGGADNFLKHYHIATPNRYDFCHLDMQSNPPLMYSNFDKVVLVGGIDKEINVESQPEPEPE